MEALGYEVTFGDEWNALPSMLRLAHSAPLKARGTGEVRYGRWGRCLKHLLRFPHEGPQSEITLCVEQRANSILWNRTFDGHRWSTLQTFRPGVMVEKIGPSLLTLEVTVEGSLIRYKQIGYSIAGVPLPPFLSPNVTAEVAEHDEGWWVHVKLTVPLFGMAMEYEAWMKPE